MDNIFTKLSERKDLKLALREWCRLNGIKISFTVNMTFTKSKNIFRNLQNTYKKGFGKAKVRWLENELKLFHFAVLAVSILTQTKIVDFDKDHWLTLQEAFPNKPQSILEYEARSFIINKNTLKKKWQQEEDKILTEIIQTKIEEPKWNQIAIQLYITSNKLFFRNGKQCRQRWLNHLDSVINHEKWSEDQDITLMRGVLQNGKKWSKIMRCFNNQRTQHMIKNRYLSLILKCRKIYPFIQDQETALIKIYQQMGLKSDDFSIYQDNIYEQRKLRVKTLRQASQLKQESQQAQKIQKNSKISFQNQSAKICSSHASQQLLIVNYPDSQVANTLQCMKLNTLSTMQTPSPSAFVAPMPFMNYNSFFPPGFGYFQLYMSDFYNNLGSSSNIHY